MVEKKNLKCEECKKCWFFGRGDWKITGWKFLRSALIVGLSGFVSVYQNDVKWLVLIPVAEASLNWLKHR